MLSEADNVDIRRETFWPLFMLKLFARRTARTAPVSDE